MGVAFWGKNTKSILPGTYSSVGIYTDLPGTRMSINDAGNFM